MASNNIMQSGKRGTFTYNNICLRPFGHLVPSLFGLAYAAIIETNFHELAVSFLDLHLEYPSVLFDSAF